MPGPRIRGGNKVLTVEKAVKAIETVRKLLPLIGIGSPIVKHGPRGETRVDIPLVYNGIALDRIHYNPIDKSFYPKGAPPHTGKTSINLYESAGELLRELRVLDAVEYREPENCWVVPLAWRSFIVAHVKVDVNGEEIVPDYGLTAEMSGRIV